MKATLLENIQSTIDQIVIKKEFNSKCDIVKMTHLEAMYLVNELERNVGDIIKDARYRLNKIHTWSFEEDKQND